MKKRGIIARVKERIGNRMSSRENSKLLSWITLVIMLFVLIYSCSENQRPDKTASSSNSLPARQNTIKTAAEPVKEDKKIDTCSVDVFLSEKEFAADSGSVKKKLILQYEYCKVLYSPTVVVEEDTARKCMVYRQIWPPIMIKAQLFARRSDKKPYRCLIYQVQKEKEDYRIDAKGTIDITVD